MKKIHYLTLAACFSLFMVIERPAIVYATGLSPEEAGEEEEKEKKLVEQKKAGKTKDEKGQGKQNQKSKDPEKCNATWRNLKC
ncbi:MAG: hypothetical protein SFW65_03175 [Alphaproteobacteria bacterium]|nr:hypothetical protein [Alphaproteobacteria bacterium]